MRKHVIKGDIYVTMQIPVEFTIDDTYGEYDPDSEFADEDGWVFDPEPYGIDEILEQEGNDHIKKDIELLEQKGWRIEEIVCEEKEQKYII